MPSFALPRRTAAGLLSLALAAAMFTACGSNEPKQVLLAGTDKNPPSDVRLTWFGIGNWSIRIGDLNVLVDGTMTRIPQDRFYGGASGMANTTAAGPIDKPAVEQANNVLGAAPGSAINLIVTGHSHFNAAFDTAYWATLTHARVVGARSTCFQTRALGVPADQCNPVEGGETLELNKYVTLRVVRWNHSGSHATDPEMHDPRELQQAPVADAAGNLRAGTTEDFPNGGGSRGYLFTVKTGAKGQLSFLVTDTGAAADLGEDSITDGVSHGKPVDSLAKALVDAKLKGVDLWISTGGQPLAEVAVPLLKPKTYIPNGLGNDFAAFSKGNTTPFQDSALASWLAANKIALVPPLQYMDAFVLDAQGVRPVDNAVMKKPWGF